MTLRVFVDANIFYSKTLTDWLFLLKRENDGMFQLHATEDIFAEVLSNLRKKNPRLPGSVTRRRTELMRICIDEVLETFPGDLPFSGIDKNDYHVHAGAMYCQADLLLTNNNPRDITSEENTHYEIIRPDDFFVYITQSASAEMLVPIVDEQIEYWSNNPHHQQLDSALRRAQCPKFSAIVRATLQKIALTR